MRIRFLKIRRSGWPLQLIRVRGAKEDFITLEDLGALINHWRWINEQDNP
jgi:hypothetical protein